MAFSNFIPTLWAESIMRDLEKEYVFVQDCDRRFEGKLEEMGDKVIIPLMDDIDVVERTLDQRYDDIPDAQHLTDRKREVMADRSGIFHFEVSDIDLAQSKYSLMSEAQKKAVYKLSGLHDTRVAALATEATHKLFTTPQRLTASRAVEGEINVLSFIDRMVQKLHENNVKGNQKMVIVVPPRFETVLLEAWRDKNTDNSGVMENGYIGKYGGVIIRRSNNVYNSGTASAPVDHIMCRTTGAISFVEQLNKITAYAPEKKFCDAVKGISVYGSQIIRPDELVAAQITYAS